MKKSFFLKRKITSRMIMGTAITASLGMATRAHAALEEVIVTAQKREQSVQEVPVAITALTQESLETNRISNVADLSGLAPNLTARPAPGGSAIAAFSMRGINSFGVVPGSDKEISIYLDGVYIGSPRGSIFTLPDIAQMEVLRGPQGTLFGRNATAGAINITTRDPSGTLGLRQELSAGNQNYRRSRTSVDSPLWGPLSFTATYLNEERDGDVKNTQGGHVWNRTAFGEGTSVTPDRFGDKDSETYFLAAKFQPTDIFTMTYKVDHSVDHGSPPANAGIAYNKGFAPLANIVAAQPTPLLLNPDSRRPSTAAASFLSPLDQTNTGHSLTTLVDVSDNASVKNITAYRKSQIKVAVDLSGLGGLVVPGTSTPFCVVCTQQYADSDQWSTEFQYNYESDAMTLTVGAMYFESDDIGSYKYSFNTTSFTAFPNYVVPAGRVATSYNDARSVAGYTQLEYHLTDEVDLVGGFRWTRDNKSGDFVTGTAPSIIHHEFTFEESKPSYVLGVNYKPTFDTLVYAKYSSAFVSGGSVGGVDFDSETAKSWEAGIKTDFLDSKLRSNLSVFDVTYSHVQTPQGGSNVGRPELGTLIIDQGSDTKAYGFEWEGSASAGYGVTLNASAGYTHVYFPDDINPVIMRSVSTNIATGATYPNSKYLPGLIPDWTANLSAQYESDPFLGTTYLSANLNGNWHSKIRLDTNPARAAANPEFGVVEFTPESWVVNSRIALKAIDLGIGEGEIAIWGRNLTDNDYPTYALNTGGLAASSSFMEARSYGVDFIVQF